MLPDPKAAGLTAKPLLPGDAEVAALREKRYPPVRVGLAVRTLAGDGLSAAALLRGTGLAEPELDDPDVRVSSLQFLTVARNALEQGAASDAGLRVGLRFRASSYGMVGYAVLCSATMRHAFDTIVRYYRLGSGMFVPGWSEAGDSAVWVFPSLEDARLPDLTPALYRFVIDLSVAALANVLKDAMGPWCVPSRLCLVGAAPRHADELARAFDCALEFDQPRNELHYPVAWLDRVPQLADPITAGEVSKTCARMLEEFKWQSGVTRRVYDELTRTPGRFPEIEDVASALCMTSRTLRRKLETEGTSYSGLLDSVRRALATDYLKASVLDTEDIAAALGFCDGASFRRAYKRWTGSSPSQLRGRAGGLPRHIGLSTMASPLSASGLSSDPRGRR